MTVVSGTAAEAAHGELLVDRAAAIPLKVAAGDAGGLAEREVLGRVERVLTAA